MWIGDKVKFTPEVVTVKKGSPVDATVIRVKHNGDVALALWDGTEVQAPKAQCEKVV